MVGGLGPPSVIPWVPPWPSRRPLCPCPAPGGTACPASSPWGPLCCECQARRWRRQLGWQVPGTQRSCCHDAGPAEGHLCPQGGGAQSRPGRGQPAARTPTSATCRIDGAAKGLQLWLHLVLRPSRAGDLHGKPPPPPAGIVPYLSDHRGQEDPHLRVDLGQERDLQQLFLWHLQDQGLQVSLRRDTVSCQPRPICKVLI